jgi:hypothetical protein
VIAGRIYETLACDECLLWVVVEGRDHGDEYADGKKARVETLVTYDGKPRPSTGSGTWDSAATKRVDRNQRSRGRTDPRWQSRRQCTAGSFA